MYGLSKIANEYGYTAQTREDLLRDLLDEKTMGLQRLEDSIPVGLKRDQNRAQLTHTLAGAGIGGTAGAAIGALTAGKGLRSLKSGMYGSDVMQIQKKLKELGFFKRKCKWKIWCRNRKSSTKIL